jgi:hypothetical protein
MTIATQSIREPMPAGAMRGAIQADGTVLWYMPGDTLPTVPVTPLADLKAARIAAINDECTARILAVWPLEKQISATVGIYGSAELAAMTAFIDAHIEASNTASDAVNVATTAAQVEAVTVAWPA